MNEDMTSAIARLSNDLDLPSVEELASEIAGLVAAQASETLDEVRLRAEALALYENRRANEVRERHFAKLRLLAEAGLGVLSYDDPTVIEKKNVRVEWQVLASAFERGHLLSSCLGQGLRTHEVMQSARNLGYTYAPGRSLGKTGSIPWSKARRIALAKAIPFEKIPPASEYVRRRQEIARQSSQRLSRAYEAEKRLARMKLRDKTAAAARDKGPKMDRAYEYLRKALQALHDAQDELAPVDRSRLSYAFTNLYEAEDVIGAVLGLRDHPLDWADAAARQTHGIVAA